MPQDLCDAVINTLYKNNGENCDCSDYRGITILFIAGKVPARVLLNIAEESIPESQCGFRANGGMIDTVFVLCQPQEKCQEHNKRLCYYCRPH